MAKDVKTRAKWNTSHSQKNFRFVTKGIVVVIDGLGDLPIRQFGERTPLEAAHTPNLDFLATRGKMGYIYPVKPGYTPSSKESLVSLFGNEPDSVSSGVLEAIGAGVELSKGDLAFRVNLGSIDSYESGLIQDRRALRTVTDSEVKSLAKAINKVKFPHPFLFVPTGHHRGVLILRGDYSNRITSVDLTYTKGTSHDAQRIEKVSPLGKDQKAIDTAEIVNSLLSEIHFVLEEHKVNKKRKSRGLLPVNFLLLRSPGVETPKLKQYKNWTSVTYSALELGFSELSGMNVETFNYPKMKSIDVYKNLWEGVKKAVKFSEKVIRRNLKKSEYFYIHFKEVDVCGHDNKPFEKKAFLEYLDKTFFKFLARIAPMNRIKVVVTGNNSTPCKFKSHSSDPVPVLLYDFSLPTEKKCFSEKEAKKGELKRFFGIDFLKAIGFSR